MGRIIDRRRVMGGKKGLLPSGYTQVEYIENTSTAYIDTGVVATFTNMTGCECKFIKNSKGGHSNGTVYISGAATAANNGFLLRWQDSIGGAYGRLTTRSGHIKNGDTVYVSLKNGILTYKVNSVDFTITLPIVNDGFVSGSIVLFDTRRGDSAYQAATLGAKMIYAKYYYGDILVRNFIPCINPNNKVGMYDTVEGTFYSSPNGVAFVAGNPV